MSQVCPKCQKASQPGARFCGACGMTLGATVVQGRTVVGAPSTSTIPLSPNQVKTIVQKAKAAFGNETVVLNPSQFATPGSAQREDTVFVIDTSGSMGAACDGRLTKIQAVIRANVAMVLNKARIDPNDEVGLVCFEDYATALMPIVPLHSHKSQIIQTLQSLSAGDGTDIDEGLKAAREMFDWSRKSLVRRVVLLTDGQGGDPLDTADDLKARGVIIDVTGVGDCPENVDEKLLRKVASTVAGEVRYRFIRDHATLIATYVQLANKTATA